VLLMILPHSAAPCHWKTGDASPLLSLVRKETGNFCCWKRGNGSY